MTFTLGPRLKVLNHGIFTIEEMVVLREEGAGVFKIYHFEKVMLFSFGYSLAERSLFAEGWIFWCFISESGDVPS